MQNQLAIVNQNFNSVEATNKFISFLDVSPLTVRAYKSGLKIFFEYLSFTGIKNPDKNDIVSFKKELEAKGRKPSTIALYLSALRRFFQWTETKGIYQNITTGIKTPKLNKGHKKDYFAGYQIKSILSGIDRSNIEGLRNYAVMALMTACGLRTVEVTRANIEDLRTVGGVPVLYVQGKGRTDKADFVKIPQQVENAIREYFKARGEIHTNEPLFTSLSKRNSGSKLTTRTISSIAKSAMINAGFNSDRLTAHSLRHTAVTLALLGGQSLSDVQAFARHTNINTTMIYNHAVSRINSQCENLIANSIF